MALLLAVAVALAGLASPTAIYGNGPPGAPVANSTSGNGPPGAPASTDDMSGSGPPG
ncbi:MAG TPA: hypothetical protein VIW69_15110 [Candidatus Elarobacter sp.]